jgi:hypothetical protein
MRNLVDREIDRGIADGAIADPEHEVPDPPGRRIVMRRYKDAVLGQEMLLRVVVEDTPQETVVVTIYKTSQIQRYLKELPP